MDILDIQAALVDLGLGTQFSAEPGTLRNDYEGQSFDRYVSEWRSWRCLDAFRLLFLRMECT